MTTKEANSERTVPGQSLAPTIPEPREKVAENDRVRVVAGDVLAPPIEKRQPERTFPYWVGSLAACPFGSPTVGPVDFQKFHQRRDSDRDLLGPPILGMIRPLTRAQLEAVAEKLPRKVVRFTMSEAEAEKRRGHPSGMLVLDKGKMAPQDAIRVRPRSGQICEYSTEADLRVRKENGLPTRGIKPLPGDEPLAQFIYCLPAPGGRHPLPDDIPPPLSETGLFLPPDNVSDFDAAAREFLKGALKPLAPVEVA